MAEEFICGNCGSYFEASPFADFCCEGCRKEFENKQENNVNQLRGNNNTH